MSDPAEPRIIQLARLRMIRTAKKVPKEKSKGPIRPLRIRLRTTHR